MAVNSVTPNRLVGMSSGMDTDTLIKNMMAIEQQKLDREMRKLTNMEWRQEALKSVASDLTAFKNTYMSAVSDKNLLSTSAFNKFNVSVTGKNSDAVTVTANSSASAGTININRVINLASAAKAESNGRISRGSELAAGNQVALQDLDFANALSYPDGEIAFAINGREFTFKATDTLQHVMNTVNASDAGVTMSYSRLTDRISITSKEMGADSRVWVRNIKGNAFAEGGKAGAFGISTDVYANGQDAALIINDTIVHKTSNEFTVDGISYSLNSTTDVDDGPIRVKLTRDYDATIDKVKDFVEGYNTMIAKLTDLLNERKTTKEKGFTALTEEEKANMTEAQIESWEKIAKKGLLTSDSGIRNVLDSLRRSIYDEVEGTGMSASELGLRTGDWQTGSMLFLDESIFRAKFEADPEMVMNVFCQNAGDDAEYSSQGILNRMDDIIYNYTKNTQANTLDSIDRSYKQLEDKIAAMEERMYALEESYYKKFAAMETAISNLNSQTSSITSLLASLTAS